MPVGALGSALLATMESANNCTLNKTQWNLTNGCQSPAGNDSSPLSEPFMRKGPEQFLQLLVALGILITNPIILIAVKRLKNRRITLHYWIAHLAVTDFSTGMIAEIRCLLDIFDLQNNATCKVIQILLVTTFCTSMTGILAISVISFKAVRSISVLNPRVNNLLKITGGQIIVTWIGWTIISMCLVLGHTTFATFDRYNCHLVSGVISRYGLLFLSVMVFIHIIGVTICQIGIWGSIRKIRQNRHTDAAVRPAEGTPRHVSHPRATASSNGTSTKSAERTGAAAGMQVEMERLALPGQIEERSSTSTSSGGNSSGIATEGAASPRNSGQRLTVPVIDVQQVAVTTPTAQAHSSADLRLARTEMRLMQSVMIVVTLFTVCYLPRGCALLAFSLGDPDNNPVSVRLVQITSIGTVLNSMMNVFVYAKKSTDFRKMFKKILTCRQD